MRNHVLSLAAIAALLAGGTGIWAMPASAEPATPTVASERRMRPGQRQHVGDPGKAALNLVTEAQNELTKGNWESAYQKLLLSDDEITHMHPKAMGVSGSAKGRPDVAHMQHMRADLRIALTAIEEGNDVKAQKRLEALRKNILIMQR